MIKLHHASRSRSMRPVWLCEEMGVPYEVVPETIGKLSDELRAINPAVSLPTLVDGDLVLFESVTMLEYIAERYGPTPLAIGRDDHRYWDYQQMLMFGEASLAAPLNTIMATVFYAPEDQRENFSVSYVRNTYKKRLKVVSDRLARGPYMMGEDFTLADISVAYSMSLGLKISRFALKDAYGEDHIAYYERIAERPAFQRMIEVR